MPKFIYTAKNYNGETKGGELISQSEQMLAQQLRSEGFLITSIREIKEESIKKSSVGFLDKFTSIPLKEKMVFARNLSVMISSGLTVSKAVLNLSVQTQNKMFKKVLADIYDEMQGGKTLNDGLGKYPGIFGDLFINMVKVGETAGNLDEVLKIIAIQIEKEHDLKRKVKGAMTYPSVILTVMVIIGIVMLTYVLPKMMGVFKDMGAELPAMTQFIVNLSDLMRNNFIMVTFGLIAFVLAIAVGTKTEKGKRMASYLAVHLPIVANIAKKVNCARFARIYSSLLKSGVGSIEALKIIANTLTNSYYRDALLAGAEEVQKGISLSQVIKDREHLFPIMVSQIIEVGEETGKTDSVLLQLAQFYEDEIDQITKNMSSIIEPVLMVVIGVAVGFFAVAMLMPMYSIMDKIK